MTYIREHVHKTNLEAAEIKLSTPSSLNVNGVFSLIGSTTSNSTISGSSLVLSAGYHFILEGSVLVRNYSVNGLIEWGFYNQSAYIGQTGFMNFVNGFGGNVRIGRRVARALITNTGSDQTIDCRIKTRTGSGWIMEITADGIQTFSYVGYPSLRIIELPA
jgi:hypothetical protein